MSNTPQNINFNILDLHNSRNSVNTHTHTHTQDNHACALVYRTFSKYTNKLNQYLAKKTSRISLEGSTAFFISIFSGILILIKNSNLNQLTAERVFSIKFFSYSVVCLFSLVCVGGAGFFYSKDKILKI